MVKQVKKSIDEEKELDNKLIKKMYILGFFFVAIVGTTLHFTYKLSGNNLFVAAFSAVNESVWEHVKIAVMPLFVWSIIELFVIKFRKPNLWTSLFLKIITVMATIIVLFYLYTSIFNTHFLFVDIALFYISIFFAQIVGYKMLKSKNVKIEYEEIAKYLVIIIFLMFVLFTFLPPKLELFKDEVTSTYGVFEFVY